MTVYLCEDGLEGILSGVYDAFMSRKGHSNVKLKLKSAEETMELFCGYQEVCPDMEKAGKVVEAIKKKISEEAYKIVYKAALSKEGDRADRIYRFLIYGFHIGPSIIDMLQIPAVYEVFQMCRFIDNETHLQTEFVRFVDMDEGLLVSKIGPKNDVLVLLAPHFADRMSGENWVIYDEHRKKAVFHPAGKQWFLADLISEEWEKRFSKASQEDEYQMLYRCFRKSISINERRNPVCQQNHMPLRYRLYMPEFSKGIRD